jgi:hypothetical protein
MKTVADNTAEEQELESIAREKDIEALKSIFYATRPLLGEPDLEDLIEQLENKSQPFWVVQYLPANQLWDFTSPCFGVLIGNDFQQVKHQLEILPAK